jgi:peptidoglycan/xylan/chitin deacetylase (PgdA/CDA1 family)
VASTPRQADVRPLVHFVWRSGLLSLTRSVHESRCLVLRYHSICDRALAEPGYVSSSISVPVDQFEQQIRHLATYYRCISLDELSDAIVGRQPMPPRAAIVTFDDGYRDNYQLALPVLARYRVPAVIYLVSSTLTQGLPLWTSRLRYALFRTGVRTIAVKDQDGRSTTTCSLGDSRGKEQAAQDLTNSLNQLSAPQREVRLAELCHDMSVNDFPHVTDWFLSLNEIEEMQREGITFGSHTVTHPNLPGIDPAEANREIETSRRDLETLLGRPVVHFSFPNSGSKYPHFSDRTKKSVADAGYRTAVTSVRGWVATPSDPLGLARVGINRSRSSLPQFACWLERSRLLGAATPVPARQ